MKKKIIFSFVVMAGLPLAAQEMQGIVNSNYSGVNGISMNPSLMADSKLYLDINILATDIFYQTDARTNAYANFRLNGPSVMLNAGRHAFAISDAVRTAISFKEVVKSNNNASSFNEYKVAGLAWGEIDLSYAYEFKREERNVWSGGITLKPLFGAGGAYFANYSNGYEFSSSIPQNITSTGVSGSGGMGSGKGFGFDIGVAYEKKHRPVNLLTYNKLSQQKFQDYDFRISASLIDLGSIKFSKNVNGTNFNNNLKGSLPGLIDTSKYNDLTDSSNYYSNSSLTKQSFSMNLPAAFCLQFDYHYKSNWYFNGTFVKGLNFSNSFVRRPTMIAVTPRFEKRWFEVNLPLSASDMKYFRLGLSFRFWNFTIGSDNLIGSLGAGSKAGLDIYASLKINFAKGRFGRKYGVSMFS